MEKRNVDICCVNNYYLGSGSSVISEEACYRVTCEGGMNSMCLHSIDKNIAYSFFRSKYMA
jgi:hypothetical protein